MNEQQMPEGIKKFREELPNKVRGAGTEGANLDCEDCGQKILVVGPGLVSMHVFVFPDAPYHTTKALCFNCMNKALREHGGKQVSAPLN